MFENISKHLEGRQNYSAARRIFNSFLGVWRCGVTTSTVFDELQNTPNILTKKTKGIKLPNAMKLKEIAHTAKALFFQGFKLRNSNKRNLIL